MAALEGCNSELTIEKGKLINCEAQMRSAIESSSQASQQSAALLANSSADLKTCTDMLSTEKINSLNCAADKQILVDKLATSERELSEIKSFARNPTCGTFIKYLPDNDRVAPGFYGFVGGVHYTGRPEYVGYGNSNCGGNQNPCAGYIDISLPNPGGYFSCSSLMYDRNGSYYLLQHPNLKWVATDITAMKTQQTAVKLVGAIHTFLYGRALYNGQHRLGKVHINTGDLGLYIQLEDNNKFTKYTTGFEILTCTP